MSENTSNTPDTTDVTVDPASITDINAYRAHVREVVLSVTAEYWLRTDEVNRILGRLGLDEVTADEVTAQESIPWIPTYADEPFDQDAPVVVADLSKDKA